MFLNYQLHHTVVPFTGIDLSPMYEKGGKAEPRWAYWDRNLMCFSASPYSSINMAIIAEEVVKGNQHKIERGKDGTELNPYQWDHVQLNLPGLVTYDPTIS